MSVPRGRGDSGWMQAMPKARSTSRGRSTSATPPRFDRSRDGSRRPLSADPYAADVPSETTAAAAQDNRLSPRQVGRGALRPHSMDSEDDGNMSDGAMDEGDIAHTPAASTGPASAARPPSSELRAAAGSAGAFRGAERRGGSPSSTAPLGAGAGWATSRDLVSRPNSPPLRAASPSPPEWAPSSSIEHVESDDEFWDRHRKTGAIARLVTYSAGESPQDDILSLACTKTGRIMVTSLKKDGPAMRADVKNGDLLASVNGSCPPVGTSAKAIRASLRAPANLVFMGFVGKLQAEVRVKYPTVRCGMPEGINVGNLAAQQGGQRPGMRYEDAVVWHQPATSLFIAATRREGLSQDEQDGDDLRDGYLGSIFELKRDDAKCILSEVIRTNRSAAAGGPQRSVYAEENNV